jgi:cysteinyl-tRNA synthetase
MSKSLKNYTTIRTVLSEEDWSARSLRICFLLMPWQDGIEVTDDLMKAVVGWEGKLNNFFLKSLDLWQRSSPNTTTIQELGIADQQLSGALDKAKAQVDTALCDSFNTSSVMRILSDLVTESNSVDTLSDETVFLLARWVTRIVTIFGLDPEGDLSNLDRIGWSGLDIPAPAKPYIHLVSQLRDKVRTLVFSGSVDHTAIAKLADGITIAASTPVVESSKPYDQVLQQFRTNIKALAARQAPTKDLLALCDQLRDVHLWNLGIYLEDRNNPQPALVRPLDKSLVEARAERELASTAKAKVKLERETREAEREKELRERAKVDPMLMFRTSNEYLEWDESGIPTVDATGNVVTKSKRKKLVKEWEKQKKMFEECLATQQAA